MQGGHSGSHAYSVGCYHYICIYGFPTTFKLRRGIAVPRFLFLKNQTLTVALVLGRQPKLIATMKKLFLIVAAMFAVVSFSACSDDDDKDVNPNQIIGTWQITREVGYEIVAGEGKMEKDITYPIDDVNDDYGFYFTYTFNEDGTGRYKSYYYYDNNKLDSNWSVEYTISNNQLMIYEEPEEGNPTSVYEIKELTKNKLVLLYKKVDDSDGYKAEITTTFKKI